MARIIWAPQATRDILEIAEHIGKDSPRHAAITVERIYNVVECLRAFPLSGRIVPEFGKKIYREVI